MKKVYLNRLKKLADHLIGGELMHKKFNFEVYNVGPYAPNGCGTSGCAAGECPAVFREWHFRNVGETYIPMLRDFKVPGVIGFDDPSLIAHCLMRFFGLTEEEQRILFIPDYFGNPDGLVIGVKTFTQLPVRSGRRRVGKNMLRFIEAKSFSGTGKNKRS